MSKTGQSKVPSLSNPIHTDKAPPVVAIKDITFAYDTARLGIESFELAPKETVAVLGPSGSGKTTLMHLLTGLLRPDTGSIQIHGTEITTLSEASIDRIRGQHVGIIFQNLHLIPSISILNNLLLAQRMARVAIDSHHAQHLLAQLGLGELSHRRPGELSQGQAQRAAIARAVVHRPSLIIADEPTSALDDTHAREAITLLKTLTVNNGAALIVVTHDERIRNQLGRQFDLRAMK